MNVFLYNVNNSCSSCALTRSQIANSFLRFLYRKQVLSDQIAKLLRSCFLNTFSVSWTRPTVNNSRVFISKSKLKQHFWIQWMLLQVQLLCICSPVFKLGKSYTNLAEQIHEQSSLHSLLIPAKRSICQWQMKLRLPVIYWLHGSWLRLGNLIVSMHWIMHSIKTEFPE